MSDIRERFRAMIRALEDLQCALKSTAKQMEDAAYAVGKYLDAVEQYHSIDSADDDHN